MANGVEKAAENTKTTEQKPKNAEPSLLCCFTAPQTTDKSKEPEEKPADQTDGKPEVPADSNPIVLSEEKHEDLGQKVENGVKTELSRVKLPKISEEVSTTIDK